MQARAEKTRSNILKNARKLFSKHGFAAASVDGIAQAAGANKQRIYAYFGSKRKLFEAVLLEVFSESAEMFNQFAANIEPGKKLTKKPEYLKDWDYHCGHSYWAYTEVTDSIFGLEGRKISTAVLNDIAETYGKEMADKLMEYKNTNFNDCD